jgi:hypothetical protein
VPALPSMAFDGASPAPELVLAEAVQPVRPSVVSVPPLPPVPPPPVPPVPPSVARLSSPMDHQAPVELPVSTIRR